MLPVQLKQRHGLSEDVGNQPLDHGRSQAGRLHAQNKVPEDAGNRPLDHGRFAGLQTRANDFRMDVVRRHRHDRIHDRLFDHSDKIGIPLPLSLYP